MNKGFQKVADSMAGKVAGSSPQRNSWLLTFGDLLTLMLTFFVSFLLFHDPEDLSANTNIQGNQKDKLSIQDFPGKIARVDGIGTPIAFLEGERNPRSLAFSVSFQEGEGRSFSSKSWDMLKKAVETETYCLSQLSLQACVPAQGLGRQADYKKHLQAALRLQSQILDATWLPKEVGLRVEQRVCNENTGARSKQKTLGGAARKKELIVYGKLERVST